MQFSTVLVIDRATLEQLEVSLPTWRANQPTLFDHPIIVMYDRATTGHEQLRLQRIIGECNCKFIAWPPPGAPDCLYADQRERMLTAFLAGAAEYVETPLWIKCDTDVLALAPSTSLIDPAWFTERECETWGVVEEQRKTVRGTPVFVAPAWRYTKSRDGRPWLTILDDWGDGREELRHFPRLDIPERSGQVRVGHRRICSWFSVWRTDWTQQAVRLLTVPHKLPVPSQDTFAWYVAARRRDPFLTVNFKHRFLNNYPRLKALREAADYVLSRTNPQSLTPA